MIDPAGPLPPSVYWRRRVAAVVATIVSVVLLAWIIGALIGDDGPGEPNAAGLAGTLTTRGSQPPSSPPPMTAHSITSASTTAPPASGTSSTPKPTTKPKPPPPMKCADAAVTVSAQVGATHYKVGQHPQLRIVITNSGQIACTREISRKLRELIVVTGDGVRRRWSSNDCAPADPTKDTRLFQPGQHVSFEITWAGRTSAHGCPVERSTVGAGKYLVVAKLGRLASRPTPLRLT